MALPFLENVKHTNRVLDQKALGLELSVNVVEGQSRSTAVRGWVQRLVSEVDALDVLVAYT
ncbi:hypothetical protein [Rubritalea sp.]|uniref:hypothetical protein n=1 Tax=Rubritalea sp. TaxID=2109375 RepID=UPI003EF13517